MLGGRATPAAWEAVIEVSVGGSLRCVSSAVSIPNKEEIQEFLGEIRSAAIGDPGFIVIDTLALSFGDGDENNARDTCDDVLRA